MRAQCAAVFNGKGTKDMIAYTPCFHDTGSGHEALSAANCPLPASLHTRDGAGLYQDGIAINNGSYSVYTEVRSLHGTTPRDSGVMAYHP